ncbi:MAG TPA: DUF4091 domain-containing protein, partial [Deltaproteobacteria bacterium]|nr:DUF4091 domain-containing protein [Deltaproteobacteria bacterium]
MTCSVRMCTALFLVVCLFAFITEAQPAHAAVTKVWANNGEDKVTRDELRAYSGSDVTNSVWNGNLISLFGAKNEVISFNMVMEATNATAQNVSVSFDTLTGPDGALIHSGSALGNGVFNWVGRNIELFYIRYLEIKGLSHDLGYNATYDERHVPKRLRRPWTGEGDATGTWEDRPDHNKFYPDIAVPLELVPQFTIAANSNQSIWADIYIPKTASRGVYQGTVFIKENGTTIYSIPVSLTVRDFALPDYPSAPTMLYLSNENINYRYLGSEYIEPGTSDYQKSLAIINRHFQVAHRHKISLIDNYIEVSQMNEAWRDRLNGTLFTMANGYDGPGMGTGNNVYSIGTYSSWNWGSWQADSKADMWSNTNAWVNWFDAQAFVTSTEYFLYLIDESDEYATQEQWAQWMDTNPGSGKKMMSMATISNPTAWENSIPSLDIPTSGIALGITSLWENATTALVQNPGKRFYYYNGARPASGTFCTEDDGVALRINGWIQHKKKIDRWFYWESTYYDNYQGGQGQTDVFTRAQTYGAKEPGLDTEFALGEYGWNYTNGDGVLFYPGSDLHYTGQSYGVDGPFASLRLKHWRRGIQDADYLALADAVDSGATRAIVERMIPKVLWEYGVANEEDPTYVYTNISWSIDPDKWEAARKELADIIEGAVPGGIDPTPEIKANGGDGPLVISHGENLTFTVSLSCGDHCGGNADWWVVELAPSEAINYFDLSTGSMVAGLLPTYQGPLFGFGSAQLLNSSDLSAGTHIFCFGVDLNMDGSLNTDSL